MNSIKVDRYAHKLSEKFNISYEDTRQILEKQIIKLEDSKTHINDIPKHAYKKLTQKFNKKGGDNYALKYNKYKQKYLQLKIEKNKN